MNEQQWVRLRLRRARGRFYVSVSDSSGWTPKAARRVWSMRDAEKFRLAISDATLKHLKTVAADSSRKSAHPVFIDVGRQWRYLPWERLLAQALPEAFPPTSVPVIEHHLAGIQQGRTAPFAVRAFGDFAEQALTVARESAPYSLGSSATTGPTLGRGSSGLKSPSTIGIDFGRSTTHRSPLLARTLLEFGSHPSGLDTVREFFTAVESGADLTNALSRIRAFPNVGELRVVSSPEALTDLDLVQLERGDSKRDPGDSGLGERFAVTLPDHMPTDVVKREDSEKYFISQAGAVGREAVARTLSQASQDRRVDIAVGSHGRGAKNYLSREAGLEIGQLYDLHVRIGERFARSLVEGIVVPVDSLLPPSGTARRLRVCVLSPDLRVIGSNSKLLSLPSSGPSRISSFTIKAPSRSGPFTARISIFYRGNLLQTFTFTGFAGGPSRKVRGKLMVRMDHQGVQTFGDMNRIPRRDLSLVLNAANGVHYVFAHGKDGNAMGPLPQAATWAAVQQLRAFLLECVKGKYETEDGLRGLASLGSALHDGIFNAEAMSAFRDDLRELSGTNDASIQVSRVDLLQAIPWPLLYDWPIPGGTASLAVCTQQKCDHDVTTVGDMICAKGFWGIRHRIEERFGRLGLVPPSKPENAESYQPIHPALLALGVFGEVTERLGDELNELATPNTITLPADTASLLDLLWNDKDRPPVVILLGHHERIDGTPFQQADDVLYVSSDGGQVSAQTITQKAKKPHARDWAWPGPVLLLLGCATAENRPTDLNGLVNTFNGLGAQAIIGTECSIHASQAVVIAKTMFGSLLGNSLKHVPPSSLGDAVRATRQTLVFERGDVSGFALTALGPDSSITWST